MAYDKSCLQVSHDHLGNRTPDYYPTSLKQAKAFMKAECKGKTHTRELLGLFFKFDHAYFTRDEIDQFDAYCNKICNNKLKIWNKARKK